MAVRCIRSSAVGVRHPGQALPEHRFLDAELNKTAPHNELDAGTRWAAANPWNSHVAQAPALACDNR